MGRTFIKHWGREKQCSCLNVSREGGVWMLEV
jgi:hypothetical protein